MEQRLTSLMSRVAATATAALPAAANAQGSTAGQPADLWTRVLLSWLPMLLLIGVWVFFMKRIGAPKDGIEPLPARGTAPELKAQLDRIERLLEEVASAVKKGR